MALDIKTGRRPVWKEWEKKYPRFHLFNCKQVITKHWVDLFISYYT